MICDILAVLLITVVPTSLFWARILTGHPNPLPRARVHRQEPHER